MPDWRSQNVWQPTQSARTTPRPTPPRYGRLRSVVAIDDGLLVTTSNTDGRGDVRKCDDRILRIPFE